MCINDECICWNSYNFGKYLDSHWDLLGCFCLICLWTDFWIYFIIFLCVFCCLWIAICFEFWNLQYFQLEYYYLFLLFSCAEFFNYRFYFYFCRFGWSVISCNHMTTKLFGGCVHVCVFGLFLSTHMFFFVGIFVNFILLKLNKLSSLRDVGSLGFDAWSFCLIFDSGIFFLWLYSLSFYGLIFKWIFSTPLFWF